MDTANHIGQTPLVPGYLEKLAEIIYSPLLRGESSLFCWPMGNAKSLFLPAVLQERYQQIYFGKRKPVANILYFSFDTDLGDSFISFLDAFRAGLKLGSKNQKNLLSLIKRLTKKAKLILIFSDLDLYPEEEFELIVDFLRKIPRLVPEKILLEVHLRHREKIDLFIRRAGQSMICQNIFKIPLPDEDETKFIITGTARNSGLVLSKAEVNKLYEICGPRIILIRAAIRLLLQEEKFRDNLYALAQAADFKLKVANMEGLEIKGSREVAVLDRSFGLTKAEAKILTLLQKSAGATVSRDEIARAIWGEDYFDSYSDYAIDKSVSRLRRKLGLAQVTMAEIKTRKGKGYVYQTH